MRSGKASGTAALVAAWRALADRGITTAKGFSDPYAIAMLSPRWKWIVDGLERRMRRRDAADRIAYFDLLALRVLAIDAELARAVDGGCVQLVLLGAGLDTRAYRCRNLAAVDVFEVDHPATQADKREKAAPLVSVARSLVYVAVDFERESLGRRLREAGHRTDLPTVWIWEGVIMYLSDDGFVSTLRALVQASAPGSVLLANYHEPSTSTERRLLRLFLRLWGEPQIGNRSRDVMRAHVEKAGLTVLRDDGCNDWAVRFGANTPVPASAETSRLLVGTLVQVRMEVIGPEPG